MQSLRRFCMSLDWLRLVQGREGGPVGRLEIMETESLFCYKS